MFSILIPYSVEDGQVYVCREMIGIPVDCFIRVLDILRQEETRLLGLVYIPAWRYDRGIRRRSASLPEDLWILFVRDDERLWDGSVVKDLQGELLPESVRRRTPLRELVAAANEYTPHEFFDNGVLMAGQVKMILKSLEKFLLEPDSLPNTVGYYSCGQYLRLFNSPSPRFDKIRICLRGETLEKARQLSPIPAELEKLQTPGPPPSVPANFAFLYYYDGRIFASRSVDGMEYYSIPRASQPDFLQVEAEPARMIRCGPISPTYLWPGKMYAEVLEGRTCLGHDYYSPAYPGGIRWVWAEEADFQETSPNSLIRFLRVSKYTPTENVNCPICLEDVSEGRMAPCGHVFCKSCIYLWTNEHEACPVCRQNLDLTPHLSNIETWMELTSARFTTMFDRGQGPVSNKIKKKILEGLHDWQYGTPGECNWKASEVFEVPSTGEKLYTWSNVKAEDQSCLVTLTNEQAKQLKIVYREARLDDTGIGAQLIISRAGAL